MIVMPANSSGWFWHSLARETGKIGHLYSPGFQRGPWPWLEYALDNGCFSLWNPAENTFDETTWRTSGEAAWRRLLFWAETVSVGPRWLIVPDRPGDGKETLLKWRIYARELHAKWKGRLAIAVQDGMEPADVRRLKIQPAVICVGGSTEWKWATVELWAKEFPRVHLLRCNSPAKLHYLESIGVESCDGTGWNRGDRVQTQGVEEWARGLISKSPWPLWPHVCRGERKGGTKGQLTFA